MVEATREYYLARIQELELELAKEKLRVTHLEMQLDLARSKLMGKDWA